jgi:PAS domain S-box-containing protein
MTRHPRNRARIALYGVLVGGVLALDVVTPLGLNVPILYLVPLLVAFLLDDVQLRLVLTALVSVLTIGALPLLWSESWRFGVANRAFDLGVFGVALLLSIRDAHIIGELKDMKHAIDKASIIVVADTRGVIRHANDRLCEVSGYTRDELIGREWRVLDGPRGAPGDFRSTVAKGNIWHGEVQNQAKDGTLYWVDTTVVPFVRDRGEVYQYLAISNDITDRKRAEARLGHQAALAKIGEMAAVVAHEVRNPLAGVRAGLQLLEGRSSLAPPETRLIHEMVSRLDLLNARVTDLLQFAHPRSPQIETLRVRPLLDEIAKAVRADRSSGSVSYRIVGHDEVVLADKAMLNEIFTNLFINARQAVTDHGEVVVTLARTGGMLEAMVTDNGSGIPDALHERVFEPFFTTKSGGTGLGLAIVRRLAEMQGGQADVMGSSPAGTTIRVRLPCAHDLSPADARTPATDQCGVLEPSGGETSAGHNRRI